MQTIEFVLRSRMGSFQEGSLTGESGNTTIFLQTGDQVSFHLARHQVGGYEREGSNLIVKLADGREIVLSDYFSGDAGDQPRVFLSSNGEIVEVDLISASENEYFAQYSSSEVWGKWSPNEELVFLEETDPLAVASAPQEYEDETVSMLGAGAILGPGLGLGGAAVAGLAGASILTGGSGGGTGGGSGGGSGVGETDKAPATVNDPDTAVTIGGDGTTEEDETELLENMLKKKVVALIEVTRARKVLSDAQVKLDEILTHSELELANEYSDTLKELATLRQNLRASQDQLNRTVLQSPMRGVVNNVSVTTIGGVVRPGEEILQIIPLDEELFVEARVKPENIANIRPGQEATIKLSAYDYTIFGTLKGRIDVLSADTFKDERTRTDDGNAHYKVRVRVDVGGLTDKQARIEIRPGIQAQVELHTGEKTVLQYLLKPLYKSREAFREP